MGTILRQETRTTTVARGRWEIVRQLGKGGQGTVHLVRDTSKVVSDDKLIPQIREFQDELGAAPDFESQKVIARKIMRMLNDRDAPEFLGAMKVLHKPEVARNPISAAARIEREIGVMSQFDHPNLLRILDYDAEKQWFVSEYHPSGALQDQQATYSGDVTAALTAIRPLVAAVAELHKAGIVHRDIKPINIFGATDGRLILGDFGLVFFADVELTRLSETFENVGTLYWMPVWAQGMRIEDVSPAMDVFSLGKLLWWMVSGLPIQRLRLWYFQKSGTNVEELYPNAPYIRLLNPLLEQCVVEEEIDCLPNAKRLLEELDKVLAIAEEYPD